MYSIAFLIPITSNGKEWSNIFESYLFKVTLPSIIRNYKKGLKFKIYIGIDDDESVYTVDNLNSLFVSLYKKHSYLTHDITVFGNVEKGFLTRMWNILALKAYNLNVHDYYLQMGDDINYLDNNFLVKSIVTMRRHNDFGVTGPTNINGAKDIITQAFVSNKHFKMYGKLYLEDVKNWHSDNWLNDIYKPLYNYRLLDSKCLNIGGMPRYDYISASGVIKEYVERDKEFISNYIETNPEILKQKPILIIGNGKSAGQIDWDWCRNNRDKFDTFGINSAYKMYEKLNFYPTYYANLDNVVIKSHSDKLQELLDTKLIRKCFYLSNVEFIENETYYKLHKVGKPWQGLSNSNLAFNTWANTGSDCVQLALMLGYKEIYIIGVDGYVEKIDEARLTNNRTLVIEETPKDNPNYWFAEYQEKGDEYNIPNASRWHKPGWDYSNAVCDKLGVKYFNLSTTRDYITTIPFMNYDEFVARIEE